MTGYDGDLAHVGPFILGWVVYVLLAVGMAGLCAALVYFLAPSAAGEWHFNADLRFSAPLVASLHFIPFMQFLQLTIFITVGTIFIRVRS